MKILIKSVKKGNAFFWDFERNITGIKIDILRLNFEML